MNTVADIELATRVARQNLLTEKFLGVGFVPLPHPDRTAKNAQSPSAGEVVILPAAREMPPSSLTRASERESVDDKSSRLNDLRDRHDRTCPHCTVVTYHTQTVFGEGNPDAAIMFVGEAPGEEEDRTGRPFVGKAGQKLTDIIKAMGFSREQVYIANILKSRPPENRTPLEPEIEACSPFLVDQIRIIRPQVLVALGNPATRFLLQTQTGITRMRGIWGTFNTSEGDLSIPVMPTFHPSYLIRSYTPENRRKVWSDMQSVLAKLKELG